MPLETGTWIADLVQTNPVGATDKMKTVDDHIRLVKSVLRQSFPGQNFPIAAANDTGIANAYKVALSPAPPAYQKYFVVVMQATNANTGACTLEEATLGAPKPIKLSDGLDPPASAIRAGGLHTFFYDGTNFILTNPSGAFVKRTGDTMTGTLTIAAANPRLVQRNTGAGVDEKEWTLEPSGTQLLGGTRTDAGAFAQAWLTVNRTGTAIGTITLGGTGLTINAPQTISATGNTALDAQLPTGAGAPRIQIGRNVGALNADNPQLRFYRWSGVASDFYATHLEQAGNGELVIRAAASAAAIGSESLTTYLTLLRDGQLTYEGPVFRISNNRPIIRLNEIVALLNEKLWEIDTTGGKFEIFTRDDADVFGQFLLKTVRSGVTVVSNAWLNGDHWFGHELPVTGTAKLDIVTSSGNAIAISNNVGNNVNKQAVISGRHYANAEEPVNLIWHNSNLNANAIDIGGGHPGYNTATSINFWVTAGSTTVGPAGNVLSLNPTGISTSVSLTVAPAIFVTHSSAPAYNFNESGAAANNRLWDLLVTGEQFVARVINDAFTVGTPWIIVDRSDTTINWVQLPNGLIFVGHNAAATGQPRIDIVGAVSPGTMCLASSTADATNKDFSIVCRHRTNVNANITVIAAESSVSDNAIKYGGGHANQNSATIHQFYTAAGTGVLNGTERVRFTDAANNFVQSTKIGGAIGDTPAETLEVAGDMRVARNAAPRIQIRRNDGSADNKMWDFHINSNTLEFRVVNDANSAAISWLVTERNTHTTINSIQFPNGGIQVGAPTGGAKGTGTINVATDIYRNNTLYAHPDFALEHYFTGKIEKFKGNPGADDYPGLMPLDELEEFLREHWHLPRIPRVPTGIFERGDIALEKIEEIFLHLIEAKRRMDDIERRIH